MIVDRLVAFGRILGDVDPATVIERDLAGLHYDLAGFPLPRQLDALLALTTVEHLHYGSDYPFTPEPVVTHLAAQLDAHGDLADRLAENTRRLFPSSDGR